MDIESVATCKCLSPLGRNLYEQNDPNVQIRIMICDKNVLGT